MITSCDTVVPGTAVSCSMDEINVEVCLVIFLEVCGDDMSFTLIVLGFKSQLAHETGNQLFVTLNGLRLFWHGFLLLLTFFFLLAFFEVDFDCLTDVLSFFGSLGCGA